ncbi:uncharacterized protein Z520_04045 [Fonsecaea multimorphosa CBS 102226]|uniref:F-box domain-containing protein n=1 Tax=Fonsecaea multimorphosa CBS 102226 TaxID=1442371 RepID=A0A0D2KB42_9EURO|nr:uncharacterized protein Z520_04045 [Fonsecaea multimorphosa CBS 102226]KIY00360.1 hypothetical protein Z520_04045 [Fonsecaea multimorphosa CBS 102226]OAL27192.1 hypothetical protein AYO22_03823 [Fonsecaea multimorphosa]
MLQDLPVEVIQQIIGHLPTASSIINLSLANHKIHSIISADDYSVFRTFVQRAFPTIDSPPYWQDVARTLTSRSRAWDRRAFVARECCPPADNSEHPRPQTPGLPVGYRPAIDSYETWQGGSWTDRKEVLAWGAAGRLQLRTIHNGVTTWTSFRVPEDHRQDLDILDVRLLRPDQNQNLDGETIVLQRANREVVRVETSSHPDIFTQKSRYTNLPNEFTCLDISQNPEPLLAACGDSCINIYTVHSPDQAARPMSSFKVEERHKLRSRMRCVKFLSENTIATGNQFLEGRERAPISIYDITPSGLSPTPVAASMSFTESSHPWAGRHSANTIAPLGDVGFSGSRPQQLFLSGWTDGIARLYDIRVPRRSVAEYVDPVDDGQILSLLPVGHERFFAGSHQNGCLKSFDFRMPGARAYSYLNARPPQTVKRPTPQRDINIFLTPTVNIGERLWEPLPRHPRKRSQRYRGSVYCLSSPSSTSPTIFAGIENHVLQLDFVSTDDFRKAHRHLGASDPNVDIVQDEKDQITGDHILNFSCYERPREGKESTDPVLLRNQTDLVDELVDGSMHSAGRREDGWDERWRLNTSGKDRGHRESGWRSLRRPSWSRRSR